MDRIKRIFPPAVLPLLLLLSSTSFPVEEWADPNLKATSGLELWLDASRLNEGSRAEGLPAVANLEPVSVWLDASGYRRNVFQLAKAFQPIYRSDLFAARKELAVLHFDGVDDHLSLQKLDLVLDHFTLFLVASPRSNPGGFHAFLALNESGKNDYTTGVTIDQGSEGRDAFDRLNVEGKGFSGEKNLRSTSSELGTTHILSVTSASSDGKISLYVDGRLSGTRSRAAGILRADEITVGARFYSNTPAPPSPTGFLDGDLAEVLLYSRLLGDEERLQVEGYLRTKHAPLLELKGAPPESPVHMLAPGFSVHELPVDLTNINDLKYVPGGRLLALGYDGRIHSLVDTDGDRLEDKVEPYWYEPTLHTPLAMAWSREGLYVTSNQKVSLLKDTDGDGLPDREEVVASGWVPPDVYTGPGVDAMGIALDAEGNLFFGLGCADFTNAYRVKDGKAAYDLQSERGTILKVPPDRKRREIFSTGIRFPVALAFNRSGDLFATDQEGETWLPGGNPLDELDQILPGRHYGFPPRHESYLPGVMDEPPVVSFSPQHQSTCGLLFNEAKAGQRPFGPSSWEGDAFVCGFSRGKLWRVQLVKTPCGYVGRPSLIAAVGLLVLQAALSPAGDLVLACHSGAPDWGNGPSGKGRLFKISYTSPNFPQAALAWSSGPMEACVAFDRPLDPKSTKDLGVASIAYGEHVRAGDRFEIHRPGYKTVAAQMDAPRGALGVGGRKLSPDGRTLVLTTDPHPLRGTYAVTLVGKDGTYDIAYDLAGIEAAFLKEKSVRAWSGWLPHLDLAVSRELTRGSADHEKLEELTQLPGRLVLRTKLELPPGQATLRFWGNVPFEATLGGQRARSAKGSSGTQEATMMAAFSGQAPELSLVLEKGTSREILDFHVSYHSSADPTERPLPIGSFLLPWAPSRPAPPPPETGPPPEIAGGDWRRGEEIFFGKDAKCSSCHAVHGKGGKIGPDLSNLAYRDARSVLRDITDPSAAIHPDYVPYTLVLTDGRVLSGLVRAQGEEKIRLADSSAQEIVISRREISELGPSAVSIMPKGLADPLGPKGLRDLLTYLTTMPSSAPALPPGAPPPRDRAEVDAVLGPLARQPSDNASRLLNIVLVAGPKDHGPGEHDYPAWQRKWKELLGDAKDVRLSTAFGWPDHGHFELADLMVFYFWNHDWSEEKYAEVDAFLARGGGMVMLHSAVIPDREPDKLAARIGLAWKPNETKFRHGPLDLEITAPAAHPITKGFSKTHLVDESYWPLLGNVARVEVLATAQEEEKPRPMAWTFKKGKGRVFCTLLGHYSWTFDDPLFRVLVLRGMAWAAGEPESRLELLAVSGVPVRD